MHPPKFDIITFGCRLNVYESAVMKELASEAGLENAIIFNSCAVTLEAERQLKQAIRKAKRDQPERQVIVTGCAAQINPAKYAAMDEVDHVIGNQEKMKPESFGLKDQKSIQVRDIMEARDTASHLVSGFDGKTRAFVQVQNGCDHRCTFCTIPYGRGNSRSVPVGVIVQQVQQLVESGYREVVLTGVDITSYGQDLPGKPTLGQMMRRLLNLVKDLPRLRLSSIDPVEIDQDIFDLLANEPRLMPHIHISLQAGADLILKRMKRRHLRGDVMDFCEKVRALRSDVVFGADIIAGFPTETDAHFQDTLDLIESTNLTYIHAFPYSARPDTPAARMPQVPKPVVKERARTLREKGALQMTKYLESLRGRVEEVLTEQGGIGRTRHYAPVLMPDVEPGHLLQVMIKDATPTHLIGERGTL